MRSNRAESFRYTFDTPLDALFKIINIDGRTVSTSPGKAKVVNISPAGMKINSSLNLRKENNSIQLQISFKINNESFDLIGGVVWKRHRGYSYDYGIDLMVDDNTQNQLIQELKSYSREILES